MKKLVFWVGYILFALSLPALAQVTMEDVIRKAVVPAEEKPADPWQYPGNQTWQTKDWEDVDEFDAADEPVLPENGGNTGTGGWVPPPPNGTFPGGGRTCSPGAPSACAGSPPRRGATCECCYGTYGIPSCDWTGGSAPGTRTHTQCMSWISTFTGGCYGKAPLNYWIVRKDTTSAASYRDARTRAERNGAGDLFRKIEFSVQCNQPSSFVAGPFREGPGQKRSVQEYVKSQLMVAQDKCCASINANSGDRYNCLYNPLK